MKKYHLSSMMLNSELSMKMLLKLLLLAFCLTEVTCQKRTTCRSLRCLRDEVRQLQTCCHEKDVSIASLIQRIEELEESQEQTMYELDQITELLNEETKKSLDIPDDEDKVVPGKDSFDVPSTTAPTKTTTRPTSSPSTGATKPTTTKAPRKRPLDCPDKWTKTGMKCFVVVSNPGVNILDVLLDCSALNTFAHPASILSEEEDNAFNTARSAANVSDTSKIWIGLNSISKGFYTWYPDNNPFNSTLVDHLDDAAQIPELFHAIYTTELDGAVVWRKEQAFKKLDGYSCSIDLAQRISTV
ncbi:unnamed protein product [Owenia fusiformis]|uniref:Uncharacterized protein n=1 Tax=Owenia fusiformis TaxID=6347 RepID=A0A8J1UN40_OWEFU|nr:unnamed protein product [Owenia fusiformis]